MFDWLGRLFFAKPMERDPRDQARLDEASAGLILYVARGCGYCALVRRAIRRWNLSIAYRDTADRAHRQALIEGGGKKQVPCLYIPAADTAPARWMYESGDIKSYLKQRFVANEGKQIQTRNTR